MRSDGCKGDTVPFAVGRWYDFPNLDVIRGRSIQVVIREISVRTGVGGDPTLVADANLHASGYAYTPWAGTIVSLAESALLKEETS